MKVVKVTASNFKEEVLEAKGTVLVDFWATWCGPCQMMGPVMDEIAAERDDIKVCKVNVDEEMEVARQYRVLSIPTFLFFEDGELKGSTMGAQPKGQLLKAMGK